MPKHKRKQVKAAYKMCYQPFMTEIDSLLTKIQYKIHRFREYCHLKDLLNGIYYLRETIEPRIIKTARQ